MNPSCLFGAGDGFQYPDSRVFFGVLCCHTSVMEGVWRWFLMLALLSRYRRCGVCDLSLYKVSHRPGGYLCLLVLLIKLVKGGRRLRSWTPCPLAAQFPDGVNMGQYYSSAGLFSRRSPVPLVSGIVVGCECKCSLARYTAAVPHYVAERSKVPDTYSG